MVTLLAAARDSERTYREGLISTSEKTKFLIDDYIKKYKSGKHNALERILNGPIWHENPILRDLKNNINDNNNTFEFKGCSYLKKSEIKEFYDKGYISSKFKFSNFSESDIQKIKNEFIDYKNKGLAGTLDPVYCKFPDYVGHLYLPNVVKLINDNYEDIVQKSMSVFNKPEEELFFSVGVFMIDESEKGENIHQDYSYYFLDQVESDIKTSLITFHVAISDRKKTRLYLYPGTHQEILHNLNTLKYIREHNIPIDEEMVMYCEGIAEYIINNGRLPYENDDVFLLSHLSRYSQLVYILDKYKNNDIEGFEINTEPGEFILFDPATLHSTGASSANIDDMIKSLEKKVSDDSIVRLSLAIRVMHTKNIHDHLLWMSAPEKLSILQRFFDDRCQENASLFSNIEPRINLKKNGAEFYTVLCNNKLISPNFPFFSVSEMYNLHAQSGAYR
jgi:hypothetical protein